MTSKKYLIIAVLATFCLTATLFMIVPTRSQSGGYDARTDVNGDGAIDMADISIGIDGFMTNGDPTLNVNVTNWPEHQSSTIIMVDNATVRFAVQDVNLGRVDVAGFGHVSLFIYYYIDGNVDLRLYPKCLDIQYNDYTAVSMHTIGTWYTGGLMAYEVSSPVINLTLHSYSATYIYLTLVLYCYN